MAWSSLLPYAFVCAHTFLWEKMLRISNGFFSEASGPMLFRFQVEPPFGWGMKDCQNNRGPFTKMAAMPIYGKNLKKSSSELNKSFGLIFAQIIGDGRSTKIAKIFDI